LKRLNHTNLKTQDLLETPALELLRHKVSLRKKLLTWFGDNQRHLPWRQNRDPYRIWLSEIMLQQTTTTAVLPYFEKFTERFPTVANLAAATEDDVVAMWSGLGYYSRARNLFRAAQTFAASGFPDNHQGLSEIPGLGPYASRAISSQAFGEAVGVVDGNVLRVVTRLWGSREDWWTPTFRNKTQNFVDALVDPQDPSSFNQGIMELGATLCTPKSPTCLLCPWRQECRSQQLGLQSEIPAPKPRRATELWLWQPRILSKGKKFALIQNDYAPFLKNSFIFPGDAMRLKQKPREYSFEHGITHHQIFVQPKVSPSPKTKMPKGLIWIAQSELPARAPSVLLQKVLRHVLQICCPLLCTGILLGATTLTLTACQSTPPQPPAEPRSLSSAKNSSTVSTTMPSIVHDEALGLAPWPSETIEILDLSPSETHALIRKTTRRGSSALQLFDWDLPADIQNRITYSDGVIESAAWVSETDVIFTSNTDLRKEHPPIFSENSAPDTPVFELFQADRQGHLISKKATPSQAFRDLQSLQQFPPEIIAFSPLSQTTHMARPVWHISSTGKVSTLPTPAPLSEGQKPLLWRKLGKPWQSVLLTSSEQTATHSLWLQKDSKSWRQLKGLPEQDFLWVAPWISEKGLWLVVLHDSVLQRQELWLLNLKSLCSVPILATTLGLQKVFASQVMQRLLFNARKPTETGFQDTVWSRPAPESLQLQAHSPETCQDGLTWTTSESGSTTK